MDQPETFPQAVAALDTNDNFALGLAAAALNEAGIIFDVVDISDEPLSDVLKAANPKWWIPPCRIFVATEDANEARSLLDPLQQGPISDIEEQSGWEKSK